MYIDFDEYPRYSGIISKNIEKKTNHNIQFCIPISTQRYKVGGATEKSVLYITDILRHKKQVSKTSNVREIEGMFVVKLRGQIIY